MKYETKVILIAVTIIAVLVIAGVWYIRSIVIVHPPPATQDRLLSPTPDHPADGIADQVDFTATPARGKAPLTVTFTAPVMIGNEHPRYEWDFGDGQTGRRRSVTHTFEKIGSYTITLVAIFEDNTRLTATKVIVAE